MDLSRFVACFNPSVALTIRKLWVLVSCWTGWFLLLNSQEWGNFDAYGCRFSEGQLLFCDGMNDHRKTWWFDRLSQISERSRERQAEPPLVQNHLAWKLECYMWLLSLEQRFRDSLHITRTISSCCPGRFNFSWRWIFSSWPSYSISIINELGRAIFS